jgi:hypothetical protein
MGLTVHAGITGAVTFRLVVNHPFIWSLSSPLSYPPLLTSRLLLIFTAAFNNTKVLP